MQLPQSKKPFKFGDRFIPNRATSNLSTFEKLQEDCQFRADSENSSQIYSSLLKRQLFPAPGQTTLKYSGKENQFASTAEPLVPMKQPRKVPRSPYKVLDAPSLQDDFYLNLVDWSSLNLLSVGLGSSVYMWNASTSKVNKLCDLGLNDSVTSVSWSQNGHHISVGTNQGKVLLWDASQGKMLRSFTGHSARVGAMAWNRNLLTTGSRDRQILHRDARVPESLVSSLLAHKQEVCGLRWSFDEQHLCSGGNDNKLMVWSLHSCTPVSKFRQHIAAVKAMAWSPHQHGLLVSGGGTADRTIRFWNTLTSEHLKCVDTGSQVCNLMFSRNNKELVSTHGYSLNQIVLWNQNASEKLATLTGHTYRVLYLAISPDGQTIVTGAGDETLRFWQIFPTHKNSDTAASSIMPSMFDLR